MTKEVDAAVLIGYAHKVSRDAPHYLREDFEQGLWYIRQGKTTWHNDEPITLDERMNLMAGEIFLNLGKVVTDRIQRKTDSNTQPNPYRETTLRVIDEVTPFHEEEKPNFPLVNFAPYPAQINQDLTIIFDSIVQSNPTMKDEFDQKWSKAEDVYKRRGTRTVVGYDTQDIINGLKDLNMEEIEPDIELDENNNVISESYNVGNLVRRTGIPEKTVEAPYYATFSEDNAAEMLGNALEDLKEVNNAIKSIGF